MTEVMTLENGYRRKSFADYRAMSCGEAKKLRQGDEVLFHCTDGKVRCAKVTSVRTWKTTPGVLVGMKFGLYEYAKAGGKYLYDSEPVDPLLVLANEDDHDRDDMPWDR